MTTQPQHTPLTPREMVTDKMLSDLAKITPEREMGELSEEHTAILATYLPEICGELLAYRLRDDVKRVAHEENRRAVLHRKPRRSRLASFDAEVRA